MFVVEDNEGLAFGLQMNLELEGYDVIIERDGSQALFVPETWHPDLILLDLSLPGLDGIELLRRWRAGNATSRIIILSGRTTEADVVSGLRLGADDYIRKPFRPRGTAGENQGAASQRE